MSKSGTKKTGASRNGLETTIEGSMRELFHAYGGRPELLLASLPKPNPTQPYGRVLKLHITHDPALYEQAPEVETYPGFMEGLQQGYADYCSGNGHRKPGHIDIQPHDSGNFAVEIRHKNIDGLMSLLDGLRAHADLPPIEHAVTRGR